VLIHASQGLTRMEYEEAAMFLVTDIPREIRLPAFAELPRGGIVGAVEIADCVTASPSPWFMGGYGFVLRHPQVLEFRPCRGALKFFRPASLTPDAKRG
jgi:hypothetical protein